MKRTTLFLIFIALLSGASATHATSAASNSASKSAAAAKVPLATKSSQSQPLQSPAAAAGQMEQEANKAAGSAPSDAAASQEPEEPKNIPFAYKGMTGHVDKRSAQRGFQIYSQVCSACHSMNLVAYRSLGALGFTANEIKAIAAQKQVDDFNDKGERIQRPALPSDHIVPPYPNEEASRAANQGAYPPDLSLITKARKGGGDYVYSLLTGFSQPPASVTPVQGKYYNPYFPGHWISMPPPLSEGVVTYQDGTPATVDQMAQDVVTFLQWAAEPEMDQRHEMGIKVLLFLIVMTVLCYVAKKRVWRDVGH